MNEEDKKWLKGLFEEQNNALNERFGRLDDELTLIKQAILENRTDLKAIGADVAIIKTQQQLHELRIQRLEEPTAV